MNRFLIIDHTAGCCLLTERYEYNRDNVLPGSDNKYNIVVPKVFGMVLDQVTFFINACKGVTTE